MQLNAVYKRIARGSFFWQLLIRTLEKHYHQSIGLGRVQGEVTSLTYPPPHPQRPPPGGKSVIQLNMCYVIMGDSISDYHYIFEAYISKQIQFHDPPRKCQKTRMHYQYITEPSVTSHHAR